MAWGTVVPLYQWGVSANFPFQGVCSPLSGPRSASPVLPPDSFWNCLLCSSYCLVLSHMLLPQCNHHSALLIAYTFTCYCHGTTSLCMAVPPAACCIGYSQTVRTQHTCSGTGQRRILFALFLLAFASATEARLSASFQIRSK